MPKNARGFNPLRIPTDLPDAPTTVTRLLEEYTRIDAERVAVGTKESRARSELPSAQAQDKAAHAAALEQDLHANQPPKRADVIEETINDCTGRRHALEQLLLRREQELDAERRANADAWTAAIEARRGQRHDRVRAAIKELATIDADNHLDDATKRYAATGKWRHLQDNKLTELLAQVADHLIEPEPRQTPAQPDTEKTNSEEVDQQTDAGG